MCTAGGVPRQSRRAAALRQRRRKHGATAALPHRRVGRAHAVAPSSGGRLVVVVAVPMGQADRVRVRFPFLVRRTDDGRRLVPAARRGKGTASPDLVQHLRIDGSHAPQDLREDAHQRAELVLVQRVRGEPRALVDGEKLRPQLGRIDQVQARQVPEILAHAHRRRPLQDLHHAWVRDRLLLRGREGGVRIEMMGGRKLQVRRRERDGFRFDQMRQFLDHGLELQVRQIRRRRGAPPGVRDVAPGGMLAVDHEHLVVGRPILLAGRVPRSRLVRDDGAPREPLDHEPSHALPDVRLLNRYPCLRDAREDAAIRVDPARVDQGRQQERDNVRARDDEDVGEPVGLVALVDGIAGGQEDEAEEDEAEEGEDGGVKDAM